MALPPPASPDELVRVVDAFFRATTAAERKPLEAALVAAQPSPATLLPALAVLASPPGSVSNEALLFCLSAAEAQLSATVVWAEDLLRSAVAALGALTAAPAVGRKASSVLALLVRRYPSQLWPAHCAAIVGLISSTAGHPWTDRARGLALLLDTCEAFSGVADGASSGGAGGGTGARRQSPRQVKASRALLTEQLPSFVALLLEQLAMRGALPSNQLLAYDAAVTLPALAVCEQLAAWAPLGAHVSPALLTQLLMIAGQAFVAAPPGGSGGGATTAASASRRAGLVALGVLTELMARNLVPPSARDFPLALAAQTVTVLEAVLAPAGHGAGAPPLLRSLPEEPVARLTAYLAAFTASLLPRVHANPALPLQRVLELLFRYTLSQPTGDGWVGALPMWAPLAAAAVSAREQQQQSQQTGASATPVAGVVYDMAFRALSGQLLDALLLCRGGASALGQLGIDASGWDDDRDDDEDDADGSGGGREAATGQSGDAADGDDGDSDPMGDEISQAAADAIGTFLASAPGSGGGDDEGDDDGGVLDDDALLRGSGNGGRGGGPLAGVYTRGQLASDRGRYLSACRRLLLQLCGASQGAASDVVTALLSHFALQATGAVTAALQPAAAAAALPTAVEDAVTLHLLLADVTLQLPHAAGVDVARAVAAARATTLQPHLRELAARVLSGGATAPHALRLLCAHVYLGKALHAIAIAAAAQAAGSIAAASTVLPPQPLVDAVGETLALLQAASGAVDLPSAGGGSGHHHHKSRLLCGQLLDALAALSSTRPGAAAIAAALTPPHWDAAVIARVLERLSPPPHRAQLLVALYRGLAAPALRPGLRGPEATAAAAAASASLQRYFAPLTAPISAAWVSSPLQVPPSDAAVQPVIAACGVLARVAAAIAGESPAALSLLLSGVAAPVIPSLSAAVMAVAASFTQGDGGSGSVFVTPEVTALAAASVTAFTTMVAACRPVIADGEMVPLVGTLAAAVATLPAALTGHDALSLPPDWTERVRTARGLVRLLRRLVRPGAGGARKAPTTTAAAVTPSPSDTIRDAALACALGPLAALVAPALSADAAAATAANANPVAAALSAVAAQELLPPVHALCRDLLRYHWRHFVATGAPDADGRRPRRLTGAAQAAAFSRLTALLTAGIGNATLSPQLCRLHLTSLALLHKEHALLALPAFTGAASSGSGSCDDPLAQAPAGPALVATLLSLLASGDRAGMDDDLRGLLWACVGHDGSGGVARFVAPGGPLEAWASGALSACPPGFACAVSPAGVQPLPQAQWPVATEVQGVLTELRQRAVATGGGSGLSASAFDEAVRSLQAALLPLAALRQRAGAGSR